MNVTISASRDREWRREVKAMASRDIDAAWRRLGRRSVVNIGMAALPLFISE